MLILDGDGIDRRNSHDGQIKTRLEAFLEMLENGRRKEQRRPVDRGGAGKSMLGYICKYAPVEVFESMGVQMERIEPDVTNFNQAEIRMHPNICSFAKGVLEEVMSSDYEGVILTTCCDSTGSTTYSEKSSRTNSSICWIRPGLRKTRESHFTNSGSGL